MRLARSDPRWEWLTHTWVGPIISLIAFASAPLLFVAERGLAWTTGIAAVATWFWWWSEVFRAWEPADLFQPAKRRYSTKARLARSLLPVAFTAAFLFQLVADVGRLNIWRQDFPEPTIAIEQCGRIAKYFEHSATRTSAAEKDEFDRAEWIRWMDAGAAKRTEGASLLFVKTAVFTKRYHTFALEIHDPGNGIQPCKSCVAFLVADEPGFTWRRHILRQVPCNSAGNFDTRLFRVQVENPNPGEYLWLFLCVTSPSSVNLDALNLQLMVRQ